MYWPSRNAKLHESSAEIATKEEESIVSTASSVAPSGAMTASVCIMASEPIKNTMRWL